MKTAIYVKTLESFKDKQVRELYKLEPTYNGIEFVIVSSILRAFDTNRPETLIFEANKFGVNLAWVDLKGSIFGKVNIPKALKGLGYTIKKN